MSMYKTPVSVLQEMAMKKKLLAPVYEISGSGPLHAMEFTCSVKTGIEQANGVGKTKKEAKHNAAVNILKHFGISMDKDAQDSGSLPSICLSNVPPGLINYVGDLNEFCSGHKFPQPSYIDSLMLRLNGLFNVSCSFLEYKTEGLGKTKKEAKQDAAKKMLILIKDKDIVHSVKLETAQPRNDIVILDQDFNEVLSKYDEIIKKQESENHQIRKKPRLEELHNNNTNPVDVDLQDVPNKIDIQNWEELVGVLEKRGLSHQVSVVQRQPLILSLKIDGYTLMHTGKSREEILEKFNRKECESVTDWTVGLPTHFISRPAVWFSESNCGLKEVIIYLKDLLLNLSRMPLVPIYEECLKRYTYKQLIDMHVGVRREYMENKSNMALDLESRLRQECELVFLELEIARRIRIDNGQDHLYWGTCCESLVHHTNK